MSWGWGNWSNWNNWQNWGNWSNSYVGHYTGSISASIDNSATIVGNGQTASIADNVSVSGSPSYDEYYSSYYFYNGYTTQSNSYYYTSNTVNPSIYSVSVQIGGASPSDQLSIDPSRLSSGSGLSISGDIVSYNGNIFATISGGANGSALNVSIDSNYSSSTSIVAQLLEAVAYSSTSAALQQSKTVNFTFNESNGTNNITGTDSVTLNFVEITSPSIVTNDVQPQISGTGEAGTFIQLYDGGTNIGSAVVQGNGTWTAQLSILPGEGPHTITAQDSDTYGNSGVSNSIIVTLDTTSPVFSTGTAFAVIEDTKAVASIVTTDANSVKYFIGGGVDANEFDIDSSSGALSFKVSPDDQGGAAGNGVFQVIVSAEDAAGNLASETIDVTVSEVAGPDVVVGSPQDDSITLPTSDLVPGASVDGGGGTNTLIITIGSGQTVDLTGVTITNIQVVQLNVPNDWSRDNALINALLDGGVQTVSWTQDSYGYSQSRDGSGNTVVTTFDINNQRSYASFSNTYTPAGDEVSSHIVYDNGLISDISYQNGLPFHQVLSDPNHTIPALDSVVTDWVNGVLAHRLTTYDNGDTLEQTYNPDGSRTDVRTDNSNSQLYTTATATFDANGLTTSGHDVYDNGRIGDFTYYADGHSHVDTFTGNASDPYTVADIVLDDAGTIIGRDYTWTDGWRHEISYDASGNATRVVNVDLGNHSAYASVETDYTAAGVLTTDILTYDTGTVTTQSYNADGSRTDATTYAAGGSIATSTASYTAAGLAISSHDVYANGQTGDFTYNANGTAQLDVIHGAASDPFSSNVTWFDGAGHPLYNAHFWKSGAEDLLGLHGGETIDAGALLNANTPTRVEIEGLGGNDTLSGAAGVANTFWFNDACLVGSDVVTNFHAGTDVIDLRAVTGLGAFADLSITPANGGADATIAFGGATITLTGVTTSQLNKGNVLA